MKKLSYLTVLVAILALIIGCTDIPTVQQEAPTRQVGSTSAAAPANRVEVCHIPPGNPANFHAITVSENALQAHLDHGDFLPLTFYADGDGDGFGDAAVPVEDCKAPAGFVADNTDCDDTDADVNPGAQEIVGDGIDNDCNPGTPDELPGLECPCWTQEQVDALHPTTAGAVFTCFPPLTTPSFESFGFNEAETAHAYQVRLSADFDVGTGGFSCFFIDTCSDGDCTNLFIFEARTLTEVQFATCKAEVVILANDRNSSCIITP